MAQESRKLEEIQQQNNEEQSKNIKIRSIKVKFCSLSDCHFRVAQRYSCHRLKNSDITVCHKSPVIGFGENSCTTASYCGKKILIACRVLYRNDRWIRGCPNHSLIIGIVRINRSRKSVSITYVKCKLCLIKLDSIYILCNLNMTISCYAWVNFRCSTYLCRTRSNQGYKTCVTVYRHDVSIK